MKLHSCRSAIGRAGRPSISINDCGEDSSLKPRIIKRYSTLEILPTQRFSRKSGINLGHLISRSYPLEPMSRGSYWRHSTSTLRNQCASTKTSGARNQSECTGVPSPSASRPSTSPSTTSSRPRPSWALINRPSLLCTTESLLYWSDP